MTPQEILLVQTSHAKVAPLEAIAANLFYTRLFRIAPDLRPLFPEDLTEQKRKLIAMLGTAVGGMAHLDMLTPAVQALGRRHAGYGVTAEHFSPMGEALLWTLEQVLGNDFTPDVEAAWTTLYGVLSWIMIDALAP